MLLKAHRHEERVSHDWALLTRQHTPPSIFDFKSLSDATLIKVAGFDATLHLQTVAQWSCCLLKYRGMIESWRLEATFWISLNLLGVRCGHSHRDCKSIKEIARYPEAVIEEITWQENAWAPMPFCKWVNETKRVYYNWLEKKKTVFSDRRAKRRKMADKVLPQRVRWFSPLDSHFRFIPSRMIHWSLVGCS